MSKITTQEASPEIEAGKDGVWGNIQRNPYRATKQAAKARKQNFHRVDLPKLLAECELIARNRKSGYCQIMQRWVPTEEVME